MFGTDNRDESASSRTRLSSLLRDRHPFARIKQWVLFSANRRHMTVALLAVVYLAMLLAGFLWPFEIQRLLTEEPTIREIMNTLLGGVILLVSIVVSVNSLVLSDELVPLDSQHERTVESWNYRLESAELIDGGVSSSVPTDFLQEMLAIAQRELAELAERLEHGETDASEEFRTALEEVEAYVVETDAVLREYRLTSADMRLFAPSYDPIRQLDHIRRVGADESLSGEAQEELETAVEAMTYFTSAREYFKTMYYKREFARLSRDLLYTGIPAVLLLSFLIIVVSGDIFPGTTLGLSHMYLFFSFAYVISLSPFFVLAAYVVRAAVIAEYTITAGGFVAE